MIKIDKSSEIPSSLQCVAPPVSGSTISKSIYGAHDVRQQLINDQSNKCCYCEVELEQKFCDVEHYRPKCSYRTGYGALRISPAYDWLAYDWQNLMYSCNICNRLCKNDYFPLQDESKRDIPNKNITNENPLIINPVTDNPSNHIRYNRYIPVPIVRKGTEDPKGKYTIEMFCLKTRHLLQRKAVWEEYNEVEQALSKTRQLLSKKDIPKDVAQKIEEVERNCENALSHFKAKSSPYSGMF